MLLTPPFFFMLIFVTFSLYAFHTHEQTTRTRFDWYYNNRTIRLLGYRHPETVLLWFLLDLILHWNLFRCHRMLPPLKVLDFPDTEHE